MPAVQDQEQTQEKEEMTAAEFVEAFSRGVKKGLNQKEIADQLGMTHASVRTRASVLRSMGVRLPYVGTRQKKIDTKALNRIVANK